MDVTSIIFTFIGIKSAGLTSSTL